MFHENIALIYNFLFVSPHFTLPVCRELKSLRAERGGGGRSTASPLQLNVNTSTANNQSASERQQGHCTQCTRMYTTTPWGHRGRQQRWALAMFFTLSRFRNESAQPIEEGKN